MESECRQCHRQQVDLRANLKCELDEECPTVPGEGGKPTQLKCGELKSALNPAGNISAANNPATLVAPVEPGKYCGTVNAEDDTKIDAVLVDLAPHLAQGRKIIEEAACYGCHPIEGYEGRPKAGPDLRHATSKLNAGWMVDWILNPKAFRPTTRMPNFFPERQHLDEYPPTAKPKYTDGFARMAAIIEQDPAKRQSALEALDSEHFQPEQQAALLASFILANSSPTEMAQGIPAGDAARGEKLVDTLGCYGCHNLTSPGESEKVDRKNRASHFDHGPDLGNIGSKTSREWIYTWIKNPKAYAPDTRMPNLRLTDQETADIATFLSSNKFVKGADGKLASKDYPANAAVQPDNKDYQIVGRKLVNYYGCYGCHYVKGFETTPGIGAELTEFGTKEVSRLDFGDYITKHTEQTWDAWLKNKLEHPRVYRYERVDTRMPQFDLCGDPREEKREECKGRENEVELLMVVLKGMRGKTRDNDFRGHKLTEAEAVRERGRELVRFYNCYGCHTVDGHTGDIRSMKQYGGDEGPRFAPPVIVGEGAKTQPEWLFEFLKAPIKLRPNLSVRMPTFGLPDDQATTLVGMFNALDGSEYPYRDYRGYTLEGPRKQQAQTAFAQAQCTQCHTLGDNPPPDIAAKGAPNLLLAKHRLRPEWLARWIRDPQVLYPGVNMPSFFNSGNPLVGLAANPATANLPGAQELSKMDAAGVIYLLRDFLMTLQPTNTAAAPAAAPARHAAR
jgi:mono/diheme cytochrome c family protein